MGHARDRGRGRGRSIDGLKARVVLFLTFCGGGAGLQPNTPPPEGIPWSPSRTARAWKMTRMRSRGRSRSRHRSRLRPWAVQYLSGARRSAQI